MTLLTTLAFNAVILAIIYLVLNRKLEKNITPEAFLEKVRSEIQSVIVELNETTDRNITLLEQRVRSLQGLIKRADKQLTVLQKEVDKHKESQEVYTHLRKAGKIVAGAPPRAENDGEPTPTSQPPGQQPEQRPAQQGTPREPAPEPEKREELPLEQRVMNLHNQGVTPASIASKLKRTTGEVELIISLYEKKEWA